MFISPKKILKELAPLRDTVGHLIEDSFLLPQAWLALWAGAGIIPLDVYEEGVNLVIKASLPGSKPEDLKIEISQNAMTISGETKLETERMEGTYFLKERRYGQFKRSVALPYPVKVEQVEAEFEDGILTLTLPKADTKTRKKYLVKLAAEAEQQAAKPEQPPVKAEQLEVKAEKPPVKARKTAAKAEKPAVKAEQREAVAEK